jgi:ABC-type multidrug transport system permease subunit
MITKKVECPKCKQIFTSSGNPGDIIRTICPSCGLAGKIIFEKTFSSSIINENAALGVINLRKEYGSLVAVNNISFSVKKGEVFAFLGHNSAGKTTTVEMIESIRQPTAGTIKILGKDINTSFVDVKEKIGVLPQEFHSFERLTVKETLEFFSKLFKKRAKIDEIINAMDLKDKENTLYMNISGGRELIKINDVETITGEFSFIDFFLPGMIGFTIIQTCIYGSLERNTKFKKDGILRKLLTTPITHSEWIFSKMFFQLFLSFVSAALIIVLGVLVYGIKININIFMILIIIGTSFLFTGIGMLISRFVKDEDSAGMAGGAVTVPMMFLAGTFFALEQMPEFLQIVGCNHFCSGFLCI